MKGLERSHGRGDLGRAPIVKQTIKVRARTLTVAGAAGVGFGSFVAGDFPQGNILFLGCVSYLTFTGPTSANLSDTWNGDYGVGTTPANDGTISVADENIVVETAVGPALAEASPRTRAVQADGSLTGQVFDNTDGSLEINVSLLVDDADIGADGIAMTVEGEIFIAYIVLGDD